MKQGATDRDICMEAWKGVGRINSYECSNCEFSQPHSSREKKIRTCIYRLSSEEPLSGGPRTSATRQILPFLGLEPSLQIFV